MMKKITLFLALLVSGAILNAQCITAENTYADLNNNGGAPCNNGTTCNLTDAGFTSFGIYGSEAYLLDNVEAGHDYTFDMCNGVGAGAWVPEITILAADGSTVDAWNGGPATGSTLTFTDQCTLTWTATQSGTYTILINELGTFSGDAPSQTGCDVTLAIDNGNPTVACGPINPALCITPDYDVTLTSIMSNGVEQSSSLANFTHIVLDYSERSSFDVSVEIENTGLMALDSTFLTYYLVDDIQNPTAGVGFTDSIEFATPLAAGATYTHTFESFGVDTLFPGMATDGTIDLYVVADSSAFNTKFEQEEDIINRLVFSPTEAYTATVGSPYSTSFEIADLGAQQFIFEHENWGWKYLDNDNDGTTFSVYQAYSNLPAQDGDFQVYGSLISGSLSAGAIDDIFQSPNLELQAGNTYAVSIWARTGFGATGEVDVKLTNSDGSYNSTLGTINLAAGDSAYSQFIFPATITTTADDYLINFEKDANGLLFLDLFELSVLEPPVANLSLVASSLDEPGVIYCDSSATVSFSATGTPSSLDLDWGDGTVESVMGMSSATHTYAGLGSYTISLTATNALGSDVATASLDFTAPPAATVVLVQPALNGNTATVTIGDDVTNSVQVTPSCARVVINWGDGTIEEVTGQSSASHTYAQSGSFTVEVTAISGGAQTVETVDVVISSISDIQAVSNIAVYPNPSNAFLNVSFDLDYAQDITISAYTITGKQVASQSFENARNINTNINTSNLVEGVYILKIKAESGVQTQRFVVEHN